PDAAAVLAGHGRLLKSEAHIVGNEQVKVTVAIIVHEAATGAPALLLAPEPGRLRNIREGAIAVIAVEEVLPVAGDEDVLKAVVVIVAYANAASPTNRVQSRFFGDVSECAVAIVLVEAIGCPLGRALKTRARQNENVHPPVVVVVKECATATSFLDNILLLPYAAVDDGRTQTGIFRYIHEPSMERATGRSRSRQWLSAVCG